MLPSDDCKLMLSDLKAYIHQEKQHQNRLNDRLSDKERNEREKESEEDKLNRSVTDSRLMKAMALLREKRQVLTEKNDVFLCTAGQVT